MLDSLAKKLRAERIKKGSVKFDSEELHFDIDEHGKPTRCYFKRSKDANKLIEEFMLLANKYVAQHVGKVVRGKKAKTFALPCARQSRPTEVENLRQFSAKFGYKLKSSGTKGATARALNALMDEVAGKSEQKVIQTVALRSMMKAKYTTTQHRHFGLAFDYYTHFTRPYAVIPTQWCTVCSLATSRGALCQPRLY